MSATVLITFGALLGLASGLQLLFISIIEVAVACLNFWIVEHIFKVVSLTILLRLLIVFISVTLYSPLSKRYSKPSVKTLRYPFSAELWRHCKLSGGGRVGIEPTTCRVYSFVPLRCNLPLSFLKKLN